ncbi:molybdopterin-dependent oxidoreductase [Frigidibacter sp. MR17.24]|uniref:molybdopterin-dependent oxidoreductase n=1 Tax=Frigidibacter sp. MR17.24 TaxID=3127345 RepID=UPI003012F540
MPVSAAHWGTFESSSRPGEPLALRPVAADRDPSALIGGMAEYRTHETRILRPAIRAGWLQAGPGQPAPGRGAEPFVEVDWPTALDFVAGEIERIRQTHGNEAIFAGSYGWSSAGRFHHAKTQLKRFINTVGGCVEQLNNYSFGAAMVLLPHVVGDIRMLYGPTTGWDAICASARLFVSFGGLPARNGQIESGGVGTHVQRDYRAAYRAAGGRMINVSPMRSDAPEAGEWLAIRPGTDTALILALCHELFATGRADRDFLARCTVGAGRLEAYLGTGNEGGAFDADWAAEITGLPATRIRTLAAEMAGTRCFINLNWSLQRADFGEQPYWAAVALAAILGQIGLPGGGLGFGFGSMNGTGNPVARLPSPVLPAPANPTGLAIPCARLTDLLLRETETIPYDGREIALPEIHMIYWAGGNPFHHHQNLNRLLRGWARPDTVVVHDHVWTATARHADIVLPATMAIERDDIASSSNDRYLVAMHQLAAPHGEARDDFWIFTELARRLGAEEAFTEGRSAADWVRHLYETTREGAAARGVTLPGYEDWRAAGVFEKPLNDTPFDAFAAFRDDPATAPLGTPSGRIELYSETVAGFGYPDCPGHPVWMRPREGLGAPLARRFPLHLLSTQPQHRLHGQLDPVAGSRASKIQGREPLRIHPRDAAERGLRDGDVARVWNDRGACLVGIALSGDLLPGVVEMATGAWFDPIHPGEPGSLDVHGNPNVLTHDRPTSSLSGGSAAQSCLVEIEAWRSSLPPIRVHSAPEFVAGRLTKTPAPGTDAREKDCPPPNRTGATP